MLQKRMAAAIATALSGLIFAALPAFGAWLNDVPQEFTQPDGEKLKCFGSGDEYYHWLHDADGFTIVKDPQTGYFVYARRSGDTWWLAVVNGPQEPRTIKVDLSFLGEGKYEAKTLPDRMDDAFDIAWMKLPKTYERVIPVATMDASQSLEIEMRSGGGFVGRFVKMKDGITK